MTTLDEMTARIVQQAQRKGWSTELYYMVGRVATELGELSKASEEFIELRDKQLQDGGYDLSEEEVEKLKVLAHSISKEAIDIYYFVNQIVAKYSGHSLDQAFEDVFNSNETKKKKTIDKSGNLVRR